MHTGQILFYDSSRGFGFIRQDAGGEDIFVQVNSLRDVGGHISQGDRVVFELQPSTRKLGKFEVANVRRESAAPATATPVRFGATI
jgi:CspA family cold shock protein